MGGRIGYSAATGVMVLVLSWLGIVALVSSLIPVVAILPILLYIGMLIGSQAFQETPSSHAPAIILAMIPQIAAWGKTMIDGALRRGGHQRGYGRLRQARQYRACSTKVWRRSAAAPRSPASFWAPSLCSSSNASSRRPQRSRSPAPCYVLRPDPRRGSRHRAVAGGCAQLCLRRRDALLLRQIRPCFAGRDRVAWPWRNERAAGGIGAIDVPARRATLVVPRPPGVDGWRGACRAGGVVGTIISSPTPTAARYCIPAIDDPIRRGSRSRQRHVAQPGIITGQNILSSTAGRFRGHLDGLVGLFAPR